MGTWHDLDAGRPIAAPLEWCAELLGVDLATICAAAANVEPYFRAAGVGCLGMCCDMQIAVEGRSSGPEWSREGT